MADSSNYQLLPPLSPEEYAALKADITRRGVQVPVEVDEEGNILDGHHRAAIAAELGLTYETIVRRGLSEPEKREHVLKLNLARRHLDAIRWGQAFVLLLKERGVDRRRGPKSEDGNSATVAEIAAEAGVPERTARHRVAQAEAYSGLRETLRARVDAGELTVSQAVGKPSPAVVPAPEVLSDLDAVIVDPRHNFIGLAAVAHVAATAALKSDGILIAFCGWPNIYHVLATVLHVLPDHWKEPPNGKTGAQLWRVNAGGDLAIVFASAVESAAELPVARLIEWGIYPGHLITSPTWGPGAIAVTGITCDRCSDSDLSEVPPRPSLPTQLGYITPLSLKLVPDLPFDHWQEIGCGLALLPQPRDEHAYRRRRDRKAGSATRRSPSSELA